MKFIFISILLLFSEINISEQEITSFFNSSDLIIKAKVIDIRAVSGMKVICNLEVEKIYKGKRVKSVLLQLDNENEMDLYKSYILYLDKKKKSVFYIKNRYVKESEEYFQNEIDFLIKLIEHKHFKKVKNPVPKHEISFGCSPK